MIDKGYAHPLFSLDLVQGTPGARQARHALRVPEGLLVADPALCARAGRIPTIACFDAVTRALANHDLGVPQFTAMGFTPAWADNMRYWQGEMQGRHNHRDLLGADQYFRVQDGQGAAQGAKALWMRLRPIFQLAGLRQSLLPPVRPNGRAALRDALRLCWERTAEPETATRLAQHGFGPPQRDELRRVIDDLDHVCSEVPAARRARQEATGGLVTIRAGLLGDLRRLARVAPLVLPPGAAKATRMPRLLSPRW